MQKWMRSHDFSVQRQMDNMSNIMFAKEFFKIIDNDDTGRLNVQELAEPLIALGLSSDSSFVEKVLKAINPSKYNSENINFAEIGLREFTKIFRKDVIAEKLTHYV
jgi:Ca2+-binding EF-hand superfamily protein